MLTPKLVYSFIVVTVIALLCMYSLWVLDYPLLSTQTQVVANLKPSGDDDEFLLPWKLNWKFIDETLSNKSAKAIWTYVEATWKGVVEDPYILNLLNGMDAPSLEIERKNSLNQKIEFNPTKISVSVHSENEDDFKYIRETWATNATNLGWRFQYFKSPNIISSLEHLVKNSPRSDWYVVINHDMWIDVITLMKKLGTLERWVPLMVGFSVHDSSDNVTLHPGAGIIVNFDAANKLISEDFKKCVQEETNHEWETIGITICAKKIHKLGVTHLEGSSPYSRITIVKNIISRDLPSDVSYKSRVNRIYYNTIMWGGNTPEEFQKNYNPPKQIPKILHQVWIGAMNKKIEKLISSCKRVNEEDGWEVKLWNIDEIKQELGEKFVGFHHLDRKDDVLKLVDTFRIYALFKYGGIYLDADSFCLQPLTPLLNEMNNSECFYTHESERHKTILLANSGFACFPYTKTQEIQLRRLQEVYDVNHINKPAWMSVGPLFVTFTLLNYKSWVNYIEKPSYYFFPVHYQDYKKFSMPSSLQVKYARYKNSYTAQFFSSTTDMLGTDEIDKFKKRMI